MKQRIETSLARARGTGPAHEGTGHWINQRITAVGNLVLIPWLIWAAAHMPSWSYMDFTAWLAVPVHAVAMVLAVMSMFYHAALGTQVIAEDYVHHEGLKILTLLGLRLGFTALGVVCVFSILKVAFAG